MEKSYKIDEIDKKILNILQKNDKISYKELEKRIELAPSSLHNRVQKMKNSGVIKSFSAILNPEKVGYDTIAWLGINVDALNLKNIANSLSNLKETQMVAISTGDHDLAVQVIAKDQKTLWNFINEKIKTIEGIKTLHVSSFIDILKMTPKINLD